MPEASVTKDIAREEPMFPGISQQRPRRWRLRFSLATLLVMVTLFGVWLGFQVNRSHRQRIAVAAIEQAGGAAFYDYQFDDQGYLDLQAGKSRELNGLDRLIGRDYFRRVVSVELDDANNDALRHLESLPDVERVFLNNNRDITDEGLVHLRKCEKLSYLDLNYTGVRGPGLARLSKLTELKFLLLSGTPIDDEGLIHVSRLSTLTDLVLMDTGVTDEGVRHLKALKNLECLYLDYGDVTDEGLGHLQHMRHLKELSITSTRTTPEAVNRLQQLLPSCKIKR